MAELAQHAAANRSEEASDWKVFPGFGFVTQIRFKSGQNRSDPQSDFEAIVREFLASLSGFPLDVDSNIAQAVFPWNLDLAFMTLVTGLSNGCSPHSLLGGGFLSDYLILTSTFAIGMDKSRKRRHAALATFAIHFDNPSPEKESKLKIFETMN